VKVRGVERVPSEPCILAPNHQSFLDGLFVTAFMRPGAVLRTLFYAKERHVRQWWLKFLAHRSNTIVMDPREGFLQSLQKLAAGLRRGDNVMIFPEGTRSRGGGLGAFKESYAVLARELGVPVVPVVIDGAHEVLPTGSRFPRVLGRVAVTYLEPVRPHADEPLSGFNERVRALIAERLKPSSLSAEAAS
jgi:long-chain acyl-CoA synthetase